MRTGQRETDHTEYAEAPRTQRGENETWLASPYSGRQPRSLTSRRNVDYCPSTIAKTSGATMLASLSMMYFGVSMPSLPHVIFSFGTAPE